MEEIEKESIASKAKKFRVPMLKPIRWFSKFFSTCYDSLAIDNLLSNAVIIKESSEDIIKNLKHELFDIKNKNTELIDNKLENENEIKKLVLNLSNLEKDTQSQKDKYVKEIGKLSKTIQDLTYSKTNLEDEVKGLRSDLNECNKKHEEKTLNNIKDNSNFINKIVKKNQNLTDELKDIKEFLKKKKIKFERL